MNRHPRLFSLALAFALTASMLAGIDRLAKFEASQAQAPQMAQAAAPRG